MRRASSSIRSGPHTAAIPPGASDDNAAPRSSRLPADVGDQPIAERASQLIREGEFVRAARAIMKPHPRALPRQRKRGAVPAA